MVLTAHDDGFFRAGVDAKPAVNASHHVDIETSGELFDFGVWMLARLDINALGRTDRRAHVTRHAFQASIVAHRQNVRAAKTLGVRARLLWIINGWRVAFEQTGKEAPQGYPKGFKCGPHRRVFLPSSFADMDDGDIHGVAAFNRRHRTTSYTGCAGVAPSEPTPSWSTPLYSGTSRRIQSNTASGSCETCTPDNFNSSAISMCKG